MILYAASMVLGTMSVIMARSGMKNIGTLLISLGVILVAVIAFIYRPPKRLFSDTAETEKTTDEVNDE